MYRYLSLPVDLLYSSVSVGQSSLLCYPLVLILVRYQSGDKRLDDANIDQETEVVARAAAGIEFEVSWYIGHSLSFGGD